MVNAAIKQCNTNSFVTKLTRDPLPIDSNLSFESLIQKINSSPQKNLHTSPIIYISQTLSHQNSFSEQTLPGWRHDEPHRGDE